MKKRSLRNSLSLLLAGVLLLSALPVGAAGSGDDQASAGEQFSIGITPLEDETPIIPIDPGTDSELPAHQVLYSWMASGDQSQDSEKFTGNYSDEKSEAALMYTAQGSQTVNMHSFLTEEANLQVDVTPSVTISNDIGAVSLSFVYAHKPNENNLNRANSGLLRVYASEDGTTWSKDFVTVRSSGIVGSYTDQNGSDIIYYEIFTEDLKTIAPGNIETLRIMPDGDSGLCGGSFSLCSLTLSGYETQRDFRIAVPSEKKGLVASRNDVLASYRNATGSDGLARVQAAMALVTRAEVDSIPAMLDTVGLRFMDGIQIKAADSVEQLFQLVLTKRLKTETEIDSIRTTYETITNTEQVIKDLNTPQQIFKAYAKCNVGDLLVQVKAAGTVNVYMVAEKASSQPDQAGNIDIATHQISYVDNNGTTYKKNTFDLYTQGFVPMVMDALADNTAQPARVDAHISATDKVQVAVSAGQNIEEIKYAVTGTTATGTVSMESPNEAKVFTADNLNALLEGAYVMELEVVTKLGSVKRYLPFTVSNFREAGRSLSLTDMVYINKYIDITGFDGVDVAANGGMLVWTDAIEEQDAVVSNENITNVSGLKKVSSAQNRYAQQTPGIWANQYAQTMYIRFYVKDGETYKYSDIQTETVQRYCEDAFRSGTKEGTKKTCAALLYYGAAAQTYFDGMTSGRVDESVPEAYAYLQEWDASLIDALEAVPTTDIMSSPALVSLSGRSLSLKEAISINYYFTVDSSIEVAEAELLFWDETATELSVTTATVKKMESQRGMYAAQSPMIYSNEMGKTVFAVARITAKDNTQYYSDVVAYSPEQYASDIIERGTQEAMKPLAKSMVTYGNCAKELFQEEN